MKRVLLFAAGIFCIFTSLSYAAKPSKSKKAPKGFVFVEGSTVEGNVKYSNGLKNYVFMEGRTVEIKDFYICDHEVTKEENSLYQKYNKDDKSFPVYFASWYDVIRYCNQRSIKEGLIPCYSINNETDPKKWGRLFLHTIPPSDVNETKEMMKVWDTVVCNWDANGYRLPTAAEWEYAARGGKEGMALENPMVYAGTSDEIELGDYAWYKQNTNRNPCEVKTKKPNTLGIYDMSGNVKEWCWDWYNTIDKDTPATGPQTGACMDFKGEEYSPALLRVFAGGSSQNEYYDCKAMAIGWGATWANGIGARLVRTKL